MPYIKLETTRTLADEEKERLAKELVAAFAQASDAKVAGNIQLAIQDGLWIDFRGDGCVGSVHVLICPGPLTPEEDYRAITQAFFPVIVRELGIPDNRIYVNVMQLDNWGFSGDLVTVKQ